MVTLPGCHYRATVSILAFALALVRRQRRRKPPGQLPPPLMPTPPLRPAPPTLSPLVVVVLATGIDGTPLPAVHASAADWTPGGAAPTTSTTTAMPPPPPPPRHRCPPGCTRVVLGCGSSVPAAIDASEARFAASESTSPSSFLQELLLPPLYSQPHQPRSPQRKASAGGTLRGRLTLPGSSCF